MEKRYALSDELLQVINEVKNQRSDKSKGQILLDRVFIISIAVIIAGLILSSVFHYIGVRNFAIWIFIVALIVFSMIFAIWVLASIVVGVKDGKFHPALRRRIAFDEDAIARFSSFSVDALTSAHSHLEREHARMTARRTTGLYLLASPAALVTIIGIAKQASQNPMLLFLKDMASRIDESGSFGISVLVAALLFGFLIGGFANHVHCETLGRLIFLIGEAARRKK
ncbi:hypothetical protein ACS7SF_00600 [Ralstonia sp. 25C]|uniref:hypothetical protein n=1 Tax=Ralstonia sp. 25C TaxID=3447363 RepID=UPI003F755F9F